MAKRSQSSALFLVLSISAFAAGPREVKPGWNLFSKQQDVELGREAAAQVERQMPVIQDGQLQDAMSNALAANSSPPAWLTLSLYASRLSMTRASTHSRFPADPTFVQHGLDSRGRQ